MISGSPPHPSRARIYPTGIASAIINAILSRTNLLGEDAMGCIGKRHLYAAAALLLATRIDAAPPPAVGEFLKAHCTNCHSGEQPKGKLDLERLAADFSVDGDRQKWQIVAERVKAGTMPPKARPRPPAEQVQVLTGWIGDRVAASDAARRKTQGRTVLRRLNRVEYENTIRDLLGIEVELQEMLPADTPADGFDNAGHALHTSSFLLEKYLEAAETALNLAIANAPQPPLVKKRFSLKDERRVQTATEKVYLSRDDDLVMFSSSPWNAITTGQFYPQHRGRYRIRVSASGHQSGGQPVSFQIDAGPMLMGTKNHLVGYFEAAAGEPTIVGFSDHFEARNTLRVLPYGLAAAQTVNKIGADQYDGPGLAVQWIEFEGPLYDQWPPESHRRIFGDSVQAQVPVPNNRNNLEVISSDPLTDAQRILRNFARRAFRREVADEEVAPFLALVEEKRAAGYTFEQAVRVGLKGILVSPEFLFLRERPGRLDDFALASRLSYFLWSTMPDDELLQIAAAGKLHEPGILRQQVERLLAHSKAQALTENFLSQWLGLRDIDFTVPDRLLYPEYDDLLKISMIEETQRFFEEVLSSDLSLTSFVASDFTFVNERLARHYGLEGVKGHAFRKVALPPDLHRGGVLTMGSVLKVTANGTVTSPIVRGSWVLERILGTPPPPPPGGVPAIEPDIRGATTIREQLAKHRQIESCASCHKLIDPPGFALESFDVIGGWRDYYRSRGGGKSVVLDGKRMSYAQGKDIDPADELADGRKFKDIDELKALLLEDKDQLARALASKLVTYATGRAPDTADRAEVDTIVANVREKKYGFRSLVHEIVQSRLFLEK